MFCRQTGSGGAFELALLGDALVRLGGALDAILLFVAFRGQHRAPSLRLYILGRRSAPRATQKSLPTFSLLIPAFWYAKCVASSHDRDPAWWRGDGVCLRPVPVPDGRSLATGVSPFQ